jgi:hypothetical protein
MTVEVPKVIGQVVLGTPPSSVIVAKVIGFVVYDPTTPVSTPQKHVRCRGRIITTAS